VEVQPKAEAAQVYSREHANGEVYTASSVEAVQGVCSAMAQLSLEEVGIALELEAMGREIMAKEEKAKPEPKPTPKKIVGRTAEPEKNQAERAEPADKPVRGAQTETAPAKPPEAKAVVSPVVHSAGHEASGRNTPPARADIRTLLAELVEVADTPKAPAAASPLSELHEADPLPPVHVNAPKNDLFEPAWLRVVSVPHAAVMAEPVQLRSAKLRAGQVVEQAVRVPEATIVAPQPAPSEVVLRSIREAVPEIQMPDNTVEWASMITPESEARFVPAVALLDPVVMTAGAESVKSMESAEAVAPGPAPAEAIEFTATSDVQSAEMQNEMAPRVETEAYASRLTGVPAVFEVALEGTASEQSSWSEPEGLAPAVRPILTGTAGVVAAEAAVNETAHDPVELADWAGVEGVAVETARDPAMPIVKLPELPEAMAPVEAAEIDFALPVEVPERADPRAEDGADEVAMEKELALPLEQDMEAKADDVLMADRDELELGLAELFDRTETVRGLDPGAFFAKAALFHRSEELTEDPEQDDGQLLPDDIGTREFLQKLQRGPAVARQAVATLCGLGRSVLRLCEVERVRRGLAVT